MSQKKIEAERFTLIDKEGKARAVLTLSGDEPCLLFYSKDGRARIEISLSRDGQEQPMIALYAKDLRSRIFISTIEEGQPKIIFTDAKNNVVWETE